MVRILFLLLIMCGSGFVLGQSAFKGLHVSKKITIIEDDTVYNFQVLEKQRDVNTKLSVRYTWFYEGSLQTTQGSYRGKLLHGTLEKTNRQGTLLEKGSYDHGTKNGVWLRWYDNGILSAKFAFRQGLRSGKFEEYYESGAVLTSGTYSKGKLNGIVNTYSPDGSLLEKIRFNNGVWVDEASKARKEQKEKSDKIKLAKRDSLQSDSSKTKKGWFRSRKRPSDTKQPGEELVNPVAEPQSPESPTQERKRRRKEKKNAPENATTQNQP